MGCQDLKIPPRPGRVEFDHQGAGIKLRVRGLRRPLFIGETGARSAGGAYREIVAAPQEFFGGVALVRNQQTPARLSESHGRSENAQ